MFVEKNYKEIFYKEILSFLGNGILFELYESLWGALDCLNKDDEEKVLQIDKDPKYKDDKERKSALEELCNETEGKKMKIIKLIQSIEKCTEKRFLSEIEIDNFIGELFNFTKHEDLMPSCKKAIDIISNMLHLFSKRIEQIKQEIQNNQNKIKDNKSKRNEPHVLPKIKLPKTKLESKIDKIIRRAEQIRLRGFIKGRKFCF